jgi:hypothetical protein
MQSTDYDLWRCAKCGRETVVPSRPHQHVECCGTGMFWDRFLVGEPYSWTPAADRRRVKP